MKLRSNCRRGPRSWFVRALDYFRLRRLDKRCGDFYLDEPPPDVGVREPRRPHPSAPGGAALLELPPPDLL